jgi:hypothetical protein
MQTSRRTWKRLTSLIGLAPLVAGSLLVLLPLNESQAQPPREAESSTVRGRIERFTTAPKGEVDGAVLDNGTRLHWPPHLEDRFTRILKEGDQVRAIGRKHTGPEGDTHVEVRSVTNLRTNSKAENPDFDHAPPPPPGPRDRIGRAAPPPPPPPPPGPARGNRALAETSTVRGRIERFTTAPKGEVDGAVLDNGTQLHWPPHLEGRFTRILKEGDEVRAIGRKETGPMGDTHFEVQSVTNLRTNSQAQNPDLAAAPPGARPAGRRRTADREQRLRELEEQVQQILQEIQRLRQEK